MQLEMEIGTSMHNKKERTIAMLHQSPNVYLGCTACPLLVSELLCSRCGTALVTNATCSSANYLCSCWIYFVNRGLYSKEEGHCKYPSPESRISVKTNRGNLKNVYFFFIFF